jgi:membrane-associated protein
MDQLFEHFKEWGQAYGYPILFAGVLLENAGLPVPGETAVLTFGFLASCGMFDVWNVILVTVLAAVIGDNIGFWIGHRWARPWLQRGQRFLLLTPRLMELTEAYFRRYGGWTIFFARFITGVRVVGALAAGTAGMAWRRFLLANALGAALWATTISLLGYFFGENREYLLKLLGRWGLVAFAVVLLVGGHFVMRALSTKALGKKEQLAADSDSQRSQAAQEPAPIQDPSTSGG